MLVIVSFVLNYVHLHALGSLSSLTCHPKSWLMDVLFSLADSPSAFKSSNSHSSLGKSLHTTHKGNSCGEMSVEKKFECSKPCTGASLISLS